MKDLIDRREAIDALDRAAECWNIAEPFNEGMRAGYKAAVTIVLSLPSAQPLVLTCDGCRHVGTYDTDFPCSGCIRREKDYYEQER